MKKDILCAAQPIFNADLNLVGHELLFRNSDTNHADILDADTATCDVLLNAYTGISSTDSFKDQHPVHITVTKNLLELKRLPLQLKERLVLKYSATLGLDEDVIRTIKELVDDNFSFSISDVEHWENYTELLPMTDYVRLNTLSENHHDMALNIRLLKSANIKIIAEKIEHFSTFHDCVELGIDEFQGFYFIEPQIVKGKKLDTSVQVAFKLIQELQNPDTSASRIESIMLQDAELSLKFLRILNCAALALPKKVKSIKEAVIIIGIDQVKEWVTLMALTNLPRKSSALFHLQLLRGAMCERLAISKQYPQPKQYFLVGIFSCLNAMLDMDMAHILIKISLDDTLVDALLHYRGSLGEVLKSVIDFEQGNWSNLPDQQLPDTTLTQTYIESLKWVNTTLPAFFTPR